MKHVYANSEGELIAADTLDQAARYHDCELGGAAEPEDGWYQVGDAAVIPVTEEDGVTVIKKTAAEWAAEHDEPGYVATTYA